MAPDILQHASLPFPRSLPEFQRLFPDDVATFYVTYERRVLSPGYTNSKLALDLYRRCVSKDTAAPLIDDLAKWQAAVSPGQKH